MRFLPVAASQSNTAAMFPQAFVQRDLDRFGIIINCLQRVLCRRFLPGVSFAIHLLQNIGRSGGSIRGWAQTSLQQFMEEQGCNMTWPSRFSVCCSFHEEMVGDRLRSIVQSDCFGGICESLNRTSHMVLACLFER